MAQRNAEEAANRRLFEATWGVPDRLKRQIIPGVSSVGHSGNVTAYAQDEETGEPVPRALHPDKPMLWDDYKARASEVRDKNMNLAPGEAPYSLPTWMGPSTSPAQKPAVLGDPEKRLATRERRSAELAERQEQVHVNQLARREGIAPWEAEIYRKPPGEMTETDAAKLDQARWMRLGPRGVNRGGYGRHGGPWAEGPRSYLGELRASKAEQEKTAWERKTTERGLDLQERELEGRLEGERTSAELGRLGTKKDELTQRKADPNLTPIEIDDLDDDIAVLDEKMAGLIRNRGAQQVPTETGEPDEGKASTPWEKEDAEYGKVSKAYRDIKRNWRLGREQLGTDADPEFGEFARQANWLLIAPDSPMNAKAFGELKRYVKLRTKIDPDFAQLPWVKNRAEAEFLKRAIEENWSYAQTKEQLQQGLDKWGNAGFLGRGFMWAPPGADMQTGKRLGLE